MNDIKKITEYYRRPDGRVYYKEFVYSMETNILGTISK